MIIERITTTNNAAIWINSVLMSMNLRVASLTFVKTLQHCRTVVIVFFFVFFYHSIMKSNVLQSETQEAVKQKTADDATICNQMEHIIA